MQLCFRPTVLSTLALLPRELSRRLNTASWPADPGSYELLYKISNGASASVYRAQCKQLDTTVAVKRLDLDTNPDLAGLIREATLLRRFQHKHVLLLYASFVVGRELWMVMPHMDLGSVRTIMRRAFPQGLDEVLIATIMRCVLQGLNYVHQNGGMHRDIKADNILISSSGDVRLADFGVASDHCRNVSIMLSRVLTRSTSTSSLESSSSSASSSCEYGGSGDEDGGGGSRHHALPAALAALRANTFVGTPCWMAPEVMQQLEEGYGNSADIWSFGITLIELATGTPPLARCHPLRVLLDTLNLPPPTLPHCEGGRKFTRAFRDLVDQCLRKDPSKRPTAAELLQHRFFKAAKGPDHLAAALLAGLLAPGSASGPPAAARAARSTPGGQAGGGPARLLSGAGRAAHSEPLLARLWSVLGLAGAGSAVLLGHSRQHSSRCDGPASGRVSSRAGSRWHFVAAAGSPFRMRSVLEAGKPAGAEAPAALADGAGAEASLARPGLIRAMHPA